MDRFWIYEGELIKVVDGDTIIADIDLGLNCWARNQYVRLDGINAPEKHGATKAAGIASMQNLGALLYASGQDRPKIWLVTTAYHEHEKYGRVLAYVYASNPGFDLTSLANGSVNQLQLDGGFAVEYNP